MRAFLLFFLVLGTCDLYGLEKSAWFGVDHELETALSSKYERFQRLDAVERSTKSIRTERSLSLNFILPIMGKYQLELEGSFAKRSRDFDFQDFALSARKVLYNDLLGDPLSLITGINMRFIPGRSLSEPILFYHSRFEGQINASVGKEWAKGRYWDWRANAFFALTQANRGCPRFNALLSMEKNFFDQHFLKLAFDTVYGLGKASLQREELFVGYRNLSYSALDTALSYRFDYDLRLKVDLEYRKRIYAHYCAKGYDAFLARLTMPFSI